LQSAIFNMGTLMRSIPSTMVNSAGVIPLASQTTRLNANLLNTAYAVAWLGQKLPPFITANLALLPFRPRSEPTKISESTETWSTTAKTYSTTLDCAPADVEYTPLGYKFDNGRGCSVPQVAIMGAGDATVLYIGYCNDPNSDWFLENKNCTVEHSNNFLAIWASGLSRTEPGKYNNLTALFCQPTYQVQGARVTVNSSSGMVANVDPGSLNGTVSSVGEVFNLTHFEFLLGVGVQPTSLRSNYPDTAIVEQYPQLARHNLTWPVSNMVGFAVGLTQHYQLSISDLSTPDSLHQAFEKVHKLLFAVAFNTQIQDSSSTELDDLHPGFIQESLGVSSWSE
jgi:hypothetical protein